MTKNPIRIAIAAAAVALFLFAVSVAHAAPTLLQPDGGGTGRGFFQSGSVLLGNGSNAIATTSRGDVTGTGISVTGGTNAVLGSGLSLVLDLINLASGVTGTLPVANGGTGVTGFGGTNRVLFTPTADQLSSNSSFTFDGTSLTAPVVAATQSGNATSTFAGNVQVTGNLRVDGQFYAPVSIVSSGNAVINGTLTATGAVTGASFASSGLGAVGTPAFSFASDLNTGLWSPTADTLALSTAGAERFRITSSGNVGIANTNPTSKLDVIGTHSDVTLDANSAAVANFRAAAHVQLALSMQAAAPYTISLQGKHTTADGFAYPIALNPNGGNVGVGTTNAGYKFTVADGTTEAAGRFNNYRGTGTNYGVYADAVGAGTYSVGGYFQGSGATYNFGVNTTMAQGSGNNWAIYSGGTAQSYFEGSVGIGSTVPSTKLHVVGTTEQFRVGYDASNYLSTTVGTTGGVVMALTGASQSMEINYAGGLTVGSVTNNAAGFYLKRNTVVLGGMTTTNNVFSLFGGTSPANHLTILSSGNVGIGTTSPTKKLSVTGTVAFDGLTASIGAGSLCLTSGKEVVYNAASDNCLSSTRASKHSIESITLGDFSILEQLQPVSFIYNDDASSTQRFGFIAEDAAAADPHLATRNASGEISGLDTNGFLAVIVDALKKVVSRQDDTDVRLEALEARLTALESENTALRSGQGIRACMLPI